MIKDITKSIVDDIFRGEARNYICDGVDIKLKKFGEYLN